MERKLKVLDLFAGIGGFALGLDSTGFFKTVKFVEKDKYCQKVLRKNFPNIPIEEDIKDVKGKRYEADVIVGGFPCQPMSVAGKRKGTDDDRYLWPEMFRLIREIKPEFVIGENVQGIINIQNGMVLRQVQDDLESEGFEVQCFLIPASGIGAWHQRYRVWIVGHSNDNGLLREVHKAENVSNTEHIRLQNQSRRGLSKLESKSGKEEKRKRDKSSFCTETSSSERRGREEDVSDTTEIGSSTQSIRNTRSMGEESKTKERREGNSSSIRTSPRSTEGREREKNVSNTTSERLERKFGKKLQGARVRFTNSSEDVSNTNNTRGRASKHGIEREGKKVDEGWKRQSQSESSGHSKDVSNTDSGLRGRGRTIQQSGENKVWRFYSEEEEQARVDIRSETIRRDAVSREEKIILQSNNERQQESNTSKESEKQTLDNRRYDKHERDVTDTNEQRTQVSTEGEYTGIEMFGSSSQKTWWQTQSDLCGVPNGISYELDKDRANRIKTLGNAIVPQIAREFGLAIKKVLSDEDII